MLFVFERNVGGGQRMYGEKTAVFLAWDHLRHYFLNSQGPMEVVPHFHRRTLVVYFSWPRSAFLREYYHHPQHRKMSANTGTESAYPPTYDRTMTGRFSNTGIRSYSARWFIDRTRLRAWTQRMARFNLGTSWMRE